MFPKLVCLVPFYSIISTTLQTLYLWEQKSANYIKILVKPLATPACISKYHNISKDDSLSVQGQVRYLVHFVQGTNLTVIQLIDGKSRKSLCLSGRARSDHSIGKITTMMSANTVRLDRFSTFGHK